MEAHCTQSLLPFIIAFVATGMYTLLVIVTASLSHLPFTCCLEISIDRPWTEMNCIAYCSRVLYRVIMMFAVRPLNIIIQFATQNQQQIFESDASVGRSTTNVQRDASILALCACLHDIRTATSTENLSNVCSPSNSCSIRLFCLSAAILVYLTIEWTLLHPFTPSLSLSREYARGRISHLTEIVANYSASDVVCYWIM